MLLIDQMIHIIVSTCDEWIDERCLELLGVHQAAQSDIIDVQPIQADCTRPKTLSSARRWPYQSIDGTMRLIRLGLFQSRGPRESSTGLHDMLYNACATMLAAGDATGIVRDLEYGFSVSWTTVHRTGSSLQSIQRC